MWLLRLRVGIYTYIKVIRGRLGDKRFYIADAPVEAFERDEMCSRDFPRVIERTRDIVYA